MAFTTVSTRPRYKARATTMRRIKAVKAATCCHEGQLTFLASAITARK